MMDLCNHSTSAQLAASPALVLMPMISSMMIGFGIYVLLRSVFVTLYTEDLQQNQQWQYDVSRINALRKVSPLYRTFQPVIRLFAKFNRTAFRDSLPEIERQIQAAGLPRYWTGAEYLGRIQLICVFLFPVYAFFSMDMMGPAGIVFAAVITFVTMLLMRRRLANRATYRLLQIKRRLPFLLDLLTLLMEAGSTFLQSLAEGVDEFRQHPVGVEFGRVLAEMSMGKTRIEAFESMRQRLDDEEITSIVGSIIQGEQLGTPLATLFRTQADVLRIKRSQRAETLANEAGVKMLAPAVMVMAATVIIILGPFIIGFIYNPFM